MKFETKFNHGDTVYMIIKYTTYKIKECETCRGTGVVEINGKTFTCPDCKGYSQQEPDGQKWGLWLYAGVSSGKVGKIVAESYDKKYCKYHDCELIEVKYMVDSTGVRSGTVWNEEDLFLTREEALKECDRRNKLDMGE